MFIKFSNTNLNMNLTPELFTSYWSAMTSETEYLDMISVSTANLFQYVSVTFFVMMIFVK